MYKVAKLLALVSVLANTPADPYLAETEAIPEVGLTKVERQYMSCASEIDMLSQDEIELIALVTMAEAESESDEGKRLVIDTILNRVDSNEFPDTVYDVIYELNAFESMWNGRVDVCYVDNDICQLVREEMYNRLNHDVVYFTAGRYGQYGTPMFQVGNHYFAGH